MTCEQLSRELYAVCRELHVEPAEMRFGRRRHRTARMVTAARALFMLRARKLGASARQLMSALELSESVVHGWLREFRQRGLL